MEDGKKEIIDLLWYTNFGEFLFDQFIRGNKEQRAIIAVMEKGLEKDNLTYAQLIQCEEDCKKFMKINDLEENEDEQIEKLTASPWTYRDNDWQMLFTVISLLKIDKVLNMKSFPPNDLNLYKDLMKMCDMSILLGKPILDGLNMKIASKLAEECERIASSMSDAKLKKFPEAFLMPPDISRRDPNIEMIEELSLVDFLHKHKILKKPVVITGQMDHWPAMQTWSLDYFRTSPIRHRYVPVHICQSNKVWTVSVMTIDDFITSHILLDNPRKGYLSNHAIFDQIEEMLHDIKIPDYCFTDKPKIDCWFGPYGTGSALHSSPKHILYCQIFGQKYLKLYDEEQADFLYGTPEKAWMSRIELSDPSSIERYTEFSKAQGLNCFLKPGQMLYIPADSWHYEQSLENSFSITFEFD